MKNKKENKKLNLWISTVPVVVLVSLLFYNIRYQNAEWFGTYSNQYILIVSGFLGLLIGLKNNSSIKHVFEEVFLNLKNVRTPIIILFLVGALSGCWLVSGIIPAMVYYGVQLLSPEIFLPATVLIAALISLVTGSSWTTSATVGIALIGVGEVLGLPKEMIAGAVLSGAYFGDKMSPMSDTTNLASVMSGTDLYAHIKYMMYTTIPTLVVTLIVFIVINLFVETSGESAVNNLLLDIDTIFNITPILFLVPLAVVGLMILKIKPVIALSSGIVLSIIVAFIYQPNIIKAVQENSFNALIDVVFFDIQINTQNDLLATLFTSSGMFGMIWTVLLIISAMFFGGVMEGIGALKVITNSLLKFAKTNFQLILSTVVSCLGLNIIASDQYLAIVIPGKMLKNSYQEKNLAPENLSRTLEDSGTVTSVLIPWNTCGAYQSTVLGVDVVSYIPFAIFNWLSPFMTLFFAALNIKIKQLQTKENISL